MVHDEVKRRTGCQGIQIPVSQLTDDPSHPELWDAATPEGIHEGAVPDSAVDPVAEKEDEKRPKYEFTPGPV
ncbi:MAG: hypothetical protein HYY02_12825 [Chloroflexi bacterium]|nr:hypothetical protein [Chloroflexota bacterium]